MRVWIGKRPCECWTDSQTPSSGDELLQPEPLREPCARETDEYRERHAHPEKITEPILPRIEDQQIAVMPDGREERDHRAKRRAYDEWLRRLVQCDGKRECD